MNEIMNGIYKLGMAVLLIVLIWEFQQHRKNTEPQLQGLVRCAYLEQP